MPGRTSSFIALITAAVLLLTSIPLDRAAAGHDITEAWNKYQEVQSDNASHDYERQRIWENLDAARNNLNWASNLQNPANWMFPVRYDNALNRLNDAENEYSAWQYHSNVLEAREHLAERNYNEAISESIGDLLLALPLPNPDAGTKKLPALQDYVTIKKPPKNRKRHSTQATNARRSQTAQSPGGHSTQATNTTRALIYLGLSAINKYSTSRGNKRRRPPSGGGGGGGSSCPGGRC